MRITFKNIPKFLTGSAIPQGTKKTGVLLMDPNGNNIYYAGDWNNYNTWHASNIVLPWLNEYQGPENVDWELVITKGLDSWNDAGGFDWLNATDELRKHRMNSDTTKTHQLYIIDNLNGLNKQILKLIENYNYPMYAITDDRFDNNGKLFGTDTDFGIHTGNRRPTIHIGSDKKSTLDWDNYYKKLGYVGAYLYLDHWVPTKDPNKASRKFGEIQNNPDEKSGSQIPADTGGNKYGFDWNKLGTALNKVLENPDIYQAARYIGNYYNNEKVYGEQLKGIHPDLRQSYNTYRQVVGDEATKLGYYRRAALGETKAARPFTADADRQVAYRNEARRVGNELRAQGDLADNQEIRRTSDESNQHQWANIQRAAEVANANLASINAANALKHNLLALKHAAQWTSTDNLLQGIEYEKKKEIEERKAIADRLFAIQQQEDIYTDPDYLKAYKEFKIQYDKHVKDGIEDDSEEYKQAKIKWKLAQANFLKKLLMKYYNFKRNYNNNIFFIKNGSKITKTRKVKDDLLYKSVKDSVDHFRKMSKISSDAQNRKKPKIEKLTSHPKGNTKKYLLGGVAPFTIFKPVALGGETSTSVQDSTSSTASKSSKEDNGLDLMKKLFESLNTEGLPSDVNSIYSTMRKLLSLKELFGDSLTSDDIASVYVSQMLKINMIKFNKAQYDETLKNANERDALSEYALDDYGRVAVLNRDSGKIFFQKLEDLDKLEGDYSLLTNMQLMNMRAYSPDLAFNYEILEAVTNNGIGMSKIADFLKSHMANLGTSKETIEGYTKLDSDNIKEGLELLKEAPAGTYKFTKYNGILLKLAAMAIQYLSSILPRNMKNVMSIHAKLNGVSPSSIILTLVGSTMSEESKLEFDAVTGKASKDSNGNDDGLKLDAATALISGKGYLGNIEFNPGTSYAVTVNARYSGFQKKSGENMGSGITMQEATTSTLDKVLDWNKATLGGSKINPTGYNRIMINNDDVVGVDLPVGSDKNTPDFTMLLKLQVLDLKLLKLGIEDTPNNFKQVNEVCLQIGLPAKYKNDGSLNNYLWNRFAAFLVTADDSVLINKNIILEDTLRIVEDDNVRELYELIILKDNNNKNYKLGNGFLGLGKQALYLGTVFVPIKSNYVASALSGGLDISMSLATDLELRERGYDLSKIATYKPAININEL